MTHMPDKNFKMSRDTKIALAFLKGSKEDRDAFKRTMIQAQLVEEAAKRAALKSKEKTPAASSNVVVSE